MKKQLDLFSVLQELEWMELELTPIAEALLRHGLVHWDDKWHTVTYEGRIIVLAERVRGAGVSPALSPVPTGRSACPSQAGLCQSDACWETGWCRKSGELLAGS